MNPICGQTQFAPSSYKGSVKNYNTNSGKNYLNDALIQSQCSINNINTNDLSSYLRFNPGETIKTTNKGEIIIPGISLQIPDFEKKYDERFQKLVENINKINNRKDIEIESTLNRYLYIAIIATSIILLTGVIILISWAINKLFY